MGNLLNCFGGQGGRVGPADQVEADALSSAFPDAQMVVPWSVDLQLLSVLVPESRSKLGFINAGTLGKFLSETTDEDKAKRAAIKQLTEELRLRQGERAGQKISKRVRVSKKLVAELFFEADPIGAEAKLGAFMGNNATLRLEIDEHYLKWVNNGDQEKLADLQKLQLDSSENSAARTMLKGWKEGQITIYVINRIYQTKSITLAVDKVEAKGGEAGIAVADLHTKGGLRFRKDKDQAALFHVESTVTDEETGQVLPCSIAFSCWELVFNAMGTQPKLGFATLPFRKAGIIGAGESSSKPTEKGRVPRLGTKTGGIVVLREYEDEEREELPDLEESRGGAQKRGAPDSGPEASVAETATGVGGTSETDSPAKKQKLMPTSDRI